MRNVHTLGIVSFFTDVSTEMAFSILPVFILTLPGSTTTTLVLRVTTYGIYYLIVGIAFFVANSTVGSLW